MWRVGPAAKDITHRHERRQGATVIAEQLEVEPMGAVRNEYGLDSDIWDDDGGCRGDCEICSRH